MKELTSRYEALAELQVALAQLRPLGAASLRNLEAAFDVELTYSSNALEGNTLTLSETGLVVDKGITVRGKPLKDHNEALDHSEALKWVRALAAHNEPLREGDIRQLHAMVLGRTSSAEAGRYSQVQRAILGSSVTLPSPAEIPALMGDFAAWLSTAESTPANAFEAHFRLVTIHPFTDDNGRTARLLMNLILLRGAYPPLVVRPEDRADYNDHLEARQLGRTDNQPYEHFLCDGLMDSFERYFSHLGKDPQVQAAFDPALQALGAKHGIDIDD